MLVLSIHQQALHDEAIEICTRITRDEALLIEVLQRIERAKLYKKFQRSSLFQYAVHELKLSEPVAYCYIAVARKASEIPTLKAAVQSGRLSVSKASRLVSALTPDNAVRLVQFASQHSCEKIDQEVARINPKTRSRDKVKFLSEELVQITITISKDGFDNLKRAESLEAQKGKKLAGRGDVLELALSEYVERHDPVKKAQRAQKRRAAIVAPLEKMAVTEGQLGSKSQMVAEVESQCTDQKLCINRVFDRARVRLTAGQKHAVFNRDQGCCTHINMRGERCTNDRYLHVHHIIPVSQGGTNDPNNLVTLCSSHHDLVHQLSLPLDNQVTWLRSPLVAYVC